MIRFLAAVLQNYKERPVLRDRESGREMTAGEFLLEIGKSCGFWREYFQDCGHHIGLLAENSTCYLIQLFGIIASGNVAVGYNGNLSKEDIRERIQISDTEVILCDDGILSEYGGHEFGIPCLDITGAFTQKAADFVIRKADEDVMLLSASGTGGRSKLVEITNDNMLVYGRYLEEFSDFPEGNDSHRRVEINLRRAAGRGICWAKPRPASAHSG